MLLRRRTSASMSLREHIKYNQTKVKKASEKASDRFMAFLQSMTAPKLLCVEDRCRVNYCLACTSPNCGLPDNSGLPLSIRPIQDSHSRSRVCVLCDVSSSNASVMKMFSFSFVAPQKAIV